MSDYKWDAQVRAEELCEELGLDYWSLSADEQYDWYQKGLDATFERLVGAADNRRKEERERT
jgi:hypothetical protein